MSLLSQLTRIRSELRSAGAAVGKLALRREEAVLSTPRPEPPVVARLIVEVRSDGSHTIARGGIEAGGESVSLEAHGSTPAQLAASLARTILTAPALLQQVARSARTSQRDLSPSRPVNPEDDESR